MENQNLNLNPDTDSFIIIHFTGLQSAAFNILPFNTSPIQMITAGEMLKWQGEKKLDEAYEASKPKLSETPKIAIPEPGTVLRDAK